MQQTPCDLIFEVISQFRGCRQIETLGSLLPQLCNRVRPNVNIQDLIPEADYAIARDVSLRTVQRERAQRVGPAFIKLGRKIYYRKEAIETWLLAKEQAQPRARAANLKSGGTAMGNTLGIALRETSQTETV